MIHLLYGEDTLSLDEKLAALRAINAADDLYDVNSTTIDGASASLIELEDGLERGAVLGGQAHSGCAGPCLRALSRAGAERAAHHRGVAPRRPAEWDGLGDRLRPCAAVD